MTVKYFNTEGTCIPEENYMVDLTGRIEKIEKHLQKNYIVLSLSFEASDEYFTSQSHLAKGLKYDLGKRLKKAGLPETVVTAWDRPFETEIPGRTGTQALFAVPEADYQ
ncbi:MAG: hypothetical protein LUF30_02675 [Lachnospiraceae bacterium]|nr:hypothetical protein [Lachnospiraceae bacterium]